MIYDATPRLRDHGKDTAHRIKNGNPGRLNKSDSDRMVIAACVAGGFSCTDDVIEDLFSVLRLGQHCSLIGDFREYGSKNSGS